jgi:pimeloyl-ACP methyl ester carboxylesterase
MATASRSEYGSLSLAPLSRGTEGAQADRRQSTALAALHQASPRRWTLPRFARYPARQRRRATPLEAAGRYFLCGARSRCDEAVRGAGGRGVAPVRRLGKTPPFRGPRGEVVPGSVAEVGYRGLGRLDQWVMIRGESIANPALILLHGGPGWSETGFFRHFNAPLEKSFTAVYWDERGAGKSFDRSIPRSSMTVEQFICDLDELIDAICRRLDKSKVAIFGHSWGSVLGVLYAARFPEKVSAYVGCGQIGDWAAAEASSYEWALAEAKRRGNRRAVRKLRAVGPPPYPAAAVFTERTWVSRFEGQMRPRALWTLARAVLGVQESSILELPSTMRGFRWSMDAMWAEVSRLNLIDLAATLQMPAAFFLGRKDHFVPPETSVAYFDALSATSKKLVWFEHSGHEMFADEPDRFNAAMAETVRPALPPDPRAT